MTKPKILMFSPREEPADIMQSLADCGLDIVWGDKAWARPGGHFEPVMVEAARDAVGLMGTSIRPSPITRRILESSQRLRIVSKYSVGVDDVDVEAATELGIMVCHAPTEANCYGVAETTVAMILSMTKRLAERDQDVRDGKWREPAHASLFLGARSDGYQGLTIGIVGLGRIGKRVAQLLVPWRVRLIAYDPYVPPADFLLSAAKPVDYETLLREADVVSYHVVLTRETRYMLREEYIRLMKPGATVINTARGKVIQEDDLARAIDEGRIRNAAIDAFEEEPLQMDSPLRKLGDRVLLSPHAAAVNEEGELRHGIAWAARALITALSGEIPDNVYNRDVIPKWKERFGGASIFSEAS